MPQTLPWPKMPNIAGIKRRTLPSRSLNCACKYFTTACAIVRRIVSVPGEAFMRDRSPFFLSELRRVILTCERAACTPVVLATAWRRGGRSVARPEHRRLRSFSAGYFVSDCSNGRL